MKTCFSFHSGYRPVNGGTAINLCAEYVIVSDLHSSWLIYIVCLDSITSRLGCLIAIKRSDFFRVDLGEPNPVFYWFLIQHMF